MSWGWGEFYLSVACNGFLNCSVVHEVGALPVVGPEEGDDVVTAFAGGEARVSGGEVFRDREGQGYPVCCFRGDGDGQDTHGGKDVFDQVYGTVLDEKTQW